MKDSRPGDERQPTRRRTTADPETHGSRPEDERQPKFTLCRARRPGVGSVKKTYTRDEVRISEEVSKWP
jgi:hypothetical protein